MVEQLNAENYVRNSVRAVVDANDGSVDRHVEALLGLFSDRPVARPATGATMAELAAGAFDGYLSALGEQHFDDAATALGRLRELLEQMTTATESDDG
jgi:hypothetical protein